MTKEDKKAKEEQLNAGFEVPEGYFSAAQLRANPPPDGVDPSIREQWLCDDEFETIFEMSKEVREESLCTLLF
jgi:hypothetical protein